MENKQLSMMDVLIETHIGLERQGPGSEDATIKALGFIDNPGEISQVLYQDKLLKISEALKQCGFKYITLDLAGYRTGSMNEALENHENMLNK